MQQLHKLGCEPAYPRRISTNSSPDPDKRSEEPPGKVAITRIVLPNDRATRPNDLYRALDASMKIS